MASDSPAEWLREMLADGRIHISGTRGLIEDRIISEGAWDMSNKEAVNLSLFLSLIT